jgi:hypothetical protein
MVGPCLHGSLNGFIEGGERSRELADPLGVSNQGKPDRPLCGPHFLDALVVLKFLHLGQGGSSQVLHDDGDGTTLLLERGQDLPFTEEDGCAEGLVRELDEERGRVRICSLDVNMNNIDKKLLLYCRCLETFNL